MAEAVATLALASSILQVIDFGTKVASTASEIYQASKRHDSSIIELENIYNRLSHALETIQNATEDNEVDAGIKSLAKSCLQLANELVDTLHNLGVRKAKTKRKAFGAALKHAWKDGKIRSLQARLNEFRSQLAVCLLVSLRQFAAQSLSKQGEILERLGKMRDGPIGTSVLEYVTSRLDASSQEQHRDFLRGDLIETIQEQKAISDDDTITRKIEVNQKVKQKSIDLFLKSLEYVGMHDREDRIADAHETTFKWIFEKGSDKWVSLGEWLESNDSLYWITGKAGSGKSTMMRYISHLFPASDQTFPRSRSHEYLERWAGSEKLIVASFYFWNSGLEAQTTQRALLMTLLREIFKQCPDLLSLSAPNRWENLCLFGMTPDWADTELKSQLFRCIKSLVRLNAKVALFVDGLDEFGGDLKALISMFGEIQKLPNQKLCVASRPWNEFRDAFAQRPSLMVEHFTHDDIKGFIIASFESDPRFIQLQSREKVFADQLIEDIVLKSSGVFLWVSLVVSSLLSGMGNGDRIADFHRRLDLLPPDLSDLYRKMIQSLEPFYLQHAAQLFALVGASREPMNLLLASYVDEGDPKLALQQEAAPLSDEGVKIRMDTMRRRINSRSRGLLEVGGGETTPQGMIDDAKTHRQVTVQYLHRTVRDFIKNDSASRRTLEAALHPAYDPHLMLLAGRLAYQKSVDPDTMDQNEWGACLVNSFFHARAVKEKNIDTMIEILDRLGEMCPQSVDLVDRHSFNQQSIRQTIYSCSFMSMATACNVVAYIRARATRPCLTNNPAAQQWPLLIDAIFTALRDPIFPTLQDAGPLTTESSNMTASAKERYKTVIEVLLENGADPDFNMKEKRGRKMGYVSPLTAVAVEYMLTKDELYLIACQSLAKNTEFGSTTINCIIEEYTQKRRTQNSGKKQLGLNSWSWYQLKKQVRKALEDAVNGSPPSSDNFWDGLLSTRLKGRDRDTSKRSFIVVSGTRARRDAFLKHDPVLR